MNTTVSESLCPPEGPFINYEAQFWGFSAPRPKPSPSHNMKANPLADLSAVPNL